MDADQRRRLFIKGPEGLEPLQLWLTEGGMPMRYESWPKVFDAASARCARLGKPSDRPCLQAFVRVPGVPTGLLQAVDRREPSARRTTPASYSHAEYEQVRSRAAEIFNSALVRIRANREHLRRWYAGAGPGRNRLPGQADRKVLVPTIVPAATWG